MLMQQYKGFNYRIYPNKEQGAKIDLTIDNTRKLHNLTVENLKNQYEQTGTFSIVYPTFFKQQEQYSYLNDTDSLAYANERQFILKSLKAYTDYLKKKKQGKKCRKVGFPKFKSKRKDKWSYMTNNQNGSIRIEDGKIKLPKIGWVKIVMHRELPEGCTYSTVVVTKTRTGKYYVSICCDYEQEVPEIVLNPYNSIGVDYSSPKLYVDNQGNSPTITTKFYTRSERKLAREQQKLSKKVLHSKNWYKQKHKIDVIHEKIRNQRRDTYWKLAVEIASREDVDFVYAESLDLLGIASKSNPLDLGEATYDNAWRTFLMMLKQELEQRGKRLVQINQYFPSSQTCSNCGERHPEMADVNNKVLICSCGANINRDVNAAINIRNEGIRLVLRENSANTNSNRRDYGVCLSE